MSGGSAFHHHHDHQHGGACCMLHMIALGFPAGNSGQTEEAPPSFLDETPKQVSTFCRDTARAGEPFVRRPSQTEPILIRNVSVLTMTETGRLEHHDVLVRGNRIAKVAPTGGIDSAGALVIDGTGRFLAPGLCDMHTHVLTVNWTEAMQPMAGMQDRPRETLTLPMGLALLQYLVAGITRIEVMAGDPDMAHLRDLVAAGEIVGPRMRVAGPLIDGPMAIQSAKMSWRVGDAAGGKRAAALIAQLGYDFAKPYSNLPAEAYAAMLEECEARGIPVLGHMPIAVGPEAISASGRQDIAHAGEFFWWLADPERSDPERMKRLAQNVAASGRYVQATVQVSGRMELFMAGKSAADFPDTQFCNPMINAMYAPDGSAKAAIEAMPHVADLIRDADALSKRMTRALNEAGVTLVTGTDAPNAFLAEGFSLHEEIAAMVSDCGLTNEEALAVLTANPAKVLGEKDQGKVAEGALADLVLLDADPLDDITATRAIHAVIANGALIDNANLQAGRRAILDAYAAMPVG